MKDKSFNTQDETQVKVVNGDTLLNRLGEISESIARRAYEIFEADGRPNGRDLDHWLRAQAELLHPSHSEVEENADSVIVRTEVPGFSADQIEVGLEPRRVIISGKRETQHEQKKGKIVYADACSDQIYRALDLPAEVDLTRASAILKNGVLELELSKAIGTPKSRTAAQGS